MRILEFVVCTVIIGVAVVLFIVLMGAVVAEVRSKNDNPSVPQRDPDPTVRFCADCATLCDATGVKLCSYSDTSVWGSSPSICECK